VTGVEGSGTELALLTESGRRIRANGVVAGIGITPNVELAKAAGLEVSDGIVVDESLRTSHPDIYAAGDVANFPDPYLGSQRRVEHEDAANSMGRAAGRAMAGDDSSYHYSPMFYSDLFDLGYEAVGRLDSRLQTDVAWDEPFHKGVITYIDQGKVAGVLLWNVWDQVEQARARLGQPFTGEMRTAVHDAQEQ
jgi:NADPH-dependent 2,4-dienoyl-CoA reductase/sulfur reductase-like enzyme